MAARQPFVLLTWFEFARADAPASNDLLRRLPALPEWSFGEQEIKVRLERPPG